MYFLCVIFFKKVDSHALRFKEYKHLYYMLHVFVCFRAFCGSTLAVLTRSSITWKWPSRKWIWTPHSEYLYSTPVKATGENFI